VAVYALSSVPLLIQISPVASPAASQIKQLTEKVLSLSSAVLSQSLTSRVISPLGQAAAP